MEVFAKLRALRDFERRHLPFLQTVQDLDLVVEIGLYELHGRSLTLKQLYLAGIGGVATIERRLARLKRHGVVIYRTSKEDRRHRELTLSRMVRKAFALYGARLDWKGARGYPN